MSPTQEVAQPARIDPQSRTRLTAADWHADAARREERESDRPRTVEERHIVGPNGADEIEPVDDLGRRWHDPRSGPRGAGDVQGGCVPWVIGVILFGPWW